MKNREILYEGKAKTIYRSDVPGEIIVLFRDDITAFDGKKKDLLKGKGMYNLAVSAFFFDYLEKNGIRTHYIRTLDNHTMLVRELRMIHLEVIVRNIAAGSIVKKYPFREGEPLDPPVIVMDYKDDALHDPMVNDDLIIALGLLSREEIAAIRKTTLAINRLLKDYFETRGIILVDLKLEFGKSDDSLLVGDEISMDSMRLWDMASGESLDKDVYRFEKGNVIQAYAHVAERILPEGSGGMI